MTPLRILSSLRFALTLFLLTAVAAAAATFFGWEEFFQSPYFLLPSGLFALSLLICTVTSLIRRPIRPVLGYAHDLAHIGILVLMMGGLLTALASREELVTIGIGESITIREEWEVTLVESRRAATNWESQLRIERGDESTRTARLAVNDPVRVGPVRLLQQSWDNPRVLILQDDAGRRYTMAPGEGFASDSTVIILEESPETELGLRFARFVDSRRSGTIAISRGMSIAELTIIDSEERVLSGIQVVHDPGAPVALAGALILFVGLLLYVIRKTREVS